MHRCTLSALAIAAALSAGLYTSDAHALALGPVHVQSALGEPLRAEIDLPQISAAEAESLRVTPASADAFRTQGLEYSSTAQNVQIMLHRRPDGTSVLRLSSRSPINDPFLDFVVDASWSSGRILRSYTLLFDPPNLRRPEASVTAAPQISTPAAAASSKPQPAPGTRSSAPAASRPAATARAQQAAPAPTPSTAAPAPSAQDVTVRAGDTAGRIAQAHRAAGVSLDQMLVAMLRANPDAFIQGNVNRLRAGAVLQLPDEAAAQATPVAEARQIIVAQSRDFNAFRQRLADAAPAAKVAAASRASGGEVQAQVQETKPTTTSPDKLTLSKGSLSAQKADAQIAEQREAGQATERRKELEKNIQELSQLSAGAGAGTAGAQGNPGAGPTIAASPTPAQPAAAAAPAEPAAPGEPAQTPATEPAPAEPASVEQTATGPAPAEPTPEPEPKPVAKPAPAPMPIEEPSLLDSLTEDPMLAGGALAIVLLLLGYGGWRYSKRRSGQENAAFSSFLESRDHPDSFFNASGGQRVDTANSSNSSSMNYSPSQLDAGGDVDPVAEADVYLAYGREEEAEKILREAARNHPQRATIPAKLAEIYGKRQDRKSLESAARQVFALSGGQGPDWNRVVELGQMHDPDNLFYQQAAGAAPQADSPRIPDPVPSGNATPEADDEIAGAPSTVLPDFDLDLELELHEAPSEPAPEEISAFAAAAASASTPLLPTLPELDLQPPASTTDSPPTASMHAAEFDSTPAPLDFSVSDLAPVEMTTEPAAFDQPTPLSTPATRPGGPESLEFDLGDLSLELPTGHAPNANSDEAPTKPTPLAVDEPLPDDPMTTKLALAAEFKAMGDSEGARALVEEVIAESGGDLQARARRMLAELG